MNPKVALEGMLVLSVLIPDLLPGQDTSAILLSTVTDPSGKTVPSAKVSVKNLTTGQATETQTDSGRVYNVANLIPGAYEVSVSEALGSHFLYRPHPRGEVRLRAPQPQMPRQTSPLVGYSSRCC